MEIRDAKLIVSTAGGTAGKGSKTYKISIPNTWVKELGLSEENRRVELILDDGTITIKQPSSIRLFFEKKQAKKHKLTAYKFYSSTMLCSLIYADFTDKTVAVENYALNTRKTAFGVNTHPTWSDFVEFLGSRCMPSTRQGIQEYLESLGLYEYDPFEIVKKTGGFMAEDHQWLEVEDL